MPEGRKQSVQEKNASEKTLTRKQSVIGLTPDLIEQLDTSFQSSKSISHILGLAWYPVYQNKMFLNMTIKKGKLKSKVENECKMLLLDFSASAGYSWQWHAWPNQCMSRTNIIIFLNDSDWAVYITCLVYISLIGQCISRVSYTTRWLVSVHQTWSPSPRQCNLQCRSTASRTDQTEGHLRGTEELPQPNQSQHQSVQPDTIQC